MQADWHQLRHDGIDRHRDFLAEAAQRHQTRRIRRRGQVVAPDAPFAVAAQQAEWAAATHLPSEDRAGEHAVFTEREWQRLVFLRWRYRRGELRD